MNEHTQTTSPKIHEEAVDAVFQQDAQEVASEKAARVDAVFAKGNPAENMNLRGEESPLLLKGSQPTPEEYAQMEKGFRPSTVLSVADNVLSAMRRLLGRR